MLEKQGSTTTRTYTYGNALVRMNGEYPLFDGLGSERTVTDSSQTVTGTLTSEAFGQTVATTGSSSSPYMFAATSGYRNDGDAGLSHVGARYYDAQVGRFLTRDTYLDQKSYAYCEHDPVNSRDPSGHIAILGDVVFIGLGILVIVVIGGPIGVAAGAAAIVYGIADAIADVMEISNRAREADLAKPNFSDPRDEYRYRRYLYPDLRDPNEYK